MLHVVNKTSGFFVNQTRYSAVALNACEPDVLLIRSALVINVYQSVGTLRSCFGMKSSEIRIIFISGYDLHQPWIGAYHSHMSIIWSSMSDWDTALVYTRSCQTYMQLITYRLYNNDNYDGHLCHSHYLYYYCRRQYLQ